MSTLEPKPTQCEKILAVLEKAEGEWVSSSVFIRDMWISQTAARICELKAKGYNIEYSADFGIPRDDLGYCKYRIPIKVEQKQEVFKWGLKPIEVESFGPDDEIKAVCLP